MLREHGLGPMSKSSLVQPPRSRLLKFNIVRFLSLFCKYRTGTPLPTTEVQRPYIPPSHFPTSKTYQRVARALQRKHHPNNRQADSSPHPVPIPCLCQPRSRIRQCYATGTLSLPVQAGAHEIAEITLHGNPSCQRLGVTPKCPSHPISFPS